MDSESISLAVLTNEVICSYLLRCCSLKTKLALGSLCKGTRSICLRHGPVRLKSGLLKTEERCRSFFLFLSSPWCSRLNFLTVALTKADWAGSAVQPLTINDGLIDLNVEIKHGNASEISCIINALGKAYSKVSTLKLSIPGPNLVTFPEEWCENLQSYFLIILDDEQNSLCQCSSSSDNESCSLLNLFPSFSQVEKLDIDLRSSCENFQDLFPQRLSQMPRLEHLKINAQDNMSLSGATQLVSLDLGFRQFCSTNLVGMKNLKTLTIRTLTLLSGVPMTVDHFPSQLSDSLEALNVHIYSNGTITNILDYVSNAYKNLKILRICGMENVMNMMYPRLVVSGVECLKRMKNLEEVVFNQVFLDAPISRHMFEKLITIRINACKGNALL